MSGWLAVPTGTGDPTETTFAFQLWIDADDQVWTVTIDTDGTFIATMVQPITTEAGAYLTTEGGTVLVTEG